MAVTYSKFTVVYQDIVYDAEGNGLHYLSTHKRIPTWLVQQIKTELAQQAMVTSAYTDLFQGLDIDGMIAELLTATKDMEIEA